MQFLSGETLIIILFCGAFVKTATALGVLRHGMGLEGPVFGIVIAILSCALSLVVLQPIVEPFGGYDRLAGDLKLQSEKGLNETFSPFFAANTLPTITERITEFREVTRSQGKTTRTPLSEKSVLVEPLPFSYSLVGYLLSEIFRAFEIALILLIPFLVVDLAVVNIFALLGIQQVSAALLSLPIKLALVVGLDAWFLIVERLLMGYQFPGTGG